MISDSILQDFLRGELAPLYKQAYPSLIGFATRVLGQGNAFLAEDCVQDAIFNAYNMRENIPSAAKLRSFLFTAIHNNAISYLRRQESMERYVELRQAQQQNMRESLEASVVYQETLDLLFEAVDSLPENLRKVFELSFYEGLKNDEIAERLLITASAVRKRKAKMVSMLRERISPEVYGLRFYGLWFKVLKI